MKRTWKKRNLGPDRIREVVRTSATLSEAARTLGVDRSTLHRWMEADPALKEPIRDRQDAAKGATAAAQMLNPDQWAEQIESLYELSNTERVTLDLARRALEIARDEFAKPTERLTAMGRFQQLVKDLNMEKPIGKAETAKLYAIK
ncbi:MAG: hypothetical protein WD795_00640 [Woeseia sp.]